MNSFCYRSEQLYAENVALDKIAKEFGTPCYVYSKAELHEAFKAYANACSKHHSLICYAVKANSNLAILNLFSNLGAGFDIVSGGELLRVLKAGGDPKKIIFSGVGKTAEEIKLALNVNILCFNVESQSELLRLNAIAGELEKIAPIALRVNPNVDAKTHPYIATGLKKDKFGIPYKDALSLYHQAANLSHIKIIGIGCHIGSNLNDISPVKEAIDKLLVLVDQLKREKIVIRQIDIGGGLGIRYSDETPPNIEDYINSVFGQLGSQNMRVIFEPGRSLVGNAGLLLCKVEYIKKGEAKNFAIVDAAMNDLIRPALYDAWHTILSVHESDIPSAIYDVVGPVCESGDFLGRDRSLKIKEGDFLAIMSAGAYGMSMSSNYNSRARAAEVMVDNDKCFLIRRREPLNSLFQFETILPNSTTEF